MMTRMPLLLMMMMMMLMIGDKGGDVAGHFLILNKSSKCVLKYFMFLEAY